MLSPSDIEVTSTLPGDLLPRFHAKEKAQRKLAREAKIREYIIYGCIIILAAVIIGLVGFFVVRQVEDTEG